VIYRKLLPFHVHDVVVAPVVSRSIEHERASYVLHAHASVPRLAVSPAPLARAKHCKQCTQTRRVASAYRLLLRRNRHSPWPLNQRETQAVERVRLHHPPFESSSKA
jgi:hypothetical protein